MGYKMQVLKILSEYIDMLDWDKDVFVMHLLDSWDEDKEVLTHELDIFYYADEITEDFIIDNIEQIIKEIKDKYERLLHFIYEDGEVLESIYKEDKNIYHAKETDILQDEWEDIHDLSEDIVTQSTLTSGVYVGTELSKRKERKTKNDMLRLYY